MLSKSAERIYWMGRYVERVENTARLIRIYSDLIYDMPPSLQLDWQSLMTILGAESVEMGAENPAESDVIAYLTTDLTNPSSLLSCLISARENVRTSRDQLPRDTWMLINGLYLKVKNNPKLMQNRTHRVNYIKEIIHTCQAFSGMLSSTMNHGQAYSFWVLGRSIERSDMVIRLLDVGGVITEQAAHKEELALYANILWANLLRANSAFQFYRQQNKGVLDGAQVVEFLLGQTAFPRSVSYCVKQLVERAGKLPNHGAIAEKLESILVKLSEPPSMHLGQSELHAYLKSLLKDVAQLNQLSYETWFTLSLDATA
jgi:uncharacterized alpha-E superfamily protein